MYGQGYAPDLRSSGLTAGHVPRAGPSMGHGWLNSYSVSCNVIVCDSTLRYSKVY